MTLDPLKTAKRFADAMDALEEARRLCDKSGEILRNAQAALDNERKEIADAVGQNVQQRLLDIGDDRVVIVKWIEKGNVNVTIAKVETS